MRIFEDDLGEKTTKRLRLECTSASLFGLANALGKKAVAKEAYFKALRAEIPELMKIETGKEERPRELDTFAAVRCRRRKTGNGCGPRDAGIAETIRARNPDGEKSRAEFERAQKSRADNP